MKDSKHGLLHFVSEAWLVILLALVFGTALAAVEIILKPRILENIRQKTLQQVPLLFSKIDQPQVEEMLVTDSNNREVTILKVIDQGQPAGWVLPGSGQGFADRIELLVAVDASFSKVMGISILKQSETPGLGDYITKETEPFRKDFASGDLSALSKIVVKKATENPDTQKNQVEAISGATISSEAVSKIVNQTLAAYKKKIQEGGE